MSQLTTAKELQWSHSEKYLERLSRAFNVVSATAAYVEDVLGVLEGVPAEDPEGPVAERLRDSIFTLKGVVDFNL